MGGRGTKKDKGSRQQQGERSEQTVSMERRKLKGQSSLPDEVTSI